MKLITISHLVFALFLGILIHFWFSSNSSSSFYLGAGLIQLSYLALALSWSLIFHKKLIALAVILIIFKYAILGAILFQIVKLQWLDFLWFSLGIASFITAAFVYAISAARKKEE